MGQEAGITTPDGTFCEDCAQYHEEENNEKVRNFWIATHIDGRQITLQGGPIDEYGGFEATIYQRDKGQIITAARISGFAAEDGTLHLTIRAKDGASLPIVAAVETER